MVEKIGAKQEK